MTSEATPSDSHGADAAPLYEEVQRAKGVVWGVLAVALAFACSLVHVVVGLARSGASVAPASLALLAGLAWALMGSILLWRLARGCRICIRADEDGLTVIRGVRNRTPLRLPYAAIAGVDTTLPRRWWWWTAFGQLGARYFAFGAKPRGAIRVVPKDGGAARAPKPITIGTDNAGELADFLRERIESNDD
jgi:hypothetical protein